MCRLSLGLYISCRLPLAVSHTPRWPCLALPTKGRACRPPLLGRRSRRRPPPRRSRKRYESPADPVPARRGLSLGPVGLDAMVPLARARLQAQLAEMSPSAPPSAIADVLNKTGGDMQRIESVPLEAPQESPPPYCEYGAPCPVPGTVQAEGPVAGFSSGSVAARVSLEVIRLRSSVRQCSSCNNNRNSNSVIV